MKTAEQILLSKFPLLPKSSNKEGMELIIEAMHEFANQSQDSMIEKVKELRLKCKLIADEYRDSSLLVRRTQSVIYDEFIEQLNAIIK